MKVKVFIPKAPLKSLSGQEIWKLAEKAIPEFMPRYLVSKKKK